MKNETHQYWIRYMQQQHQQASMWAECLLCVSVEGREWKNKAIKACYSLMHFIQIEIMQYIWFWAHKKRKFCFNQNKAISGCKIVPNENNLKRFKNNDECASLHLIIFLFLKNDSSTYSFNNRRLCVKLTSNTFQKLVAITWWSYF